MQLALLSLICFLAIASIVGAVLFFLKDLVFGGAQKSGGVLVRGLPRLPSLDEAPAKGLLGGMSQNFDRMVLESGLEMTSIAGILFMLCIGLLVGGALFIWNENPITAVVGVAIGMGLGLLFLIVKRARRMKLLEEQLPDALDLLSRAVRAGESLEQAIALLGRKGPKPLAVEFSRCAGQLEMGLSIPATMRALARRIRTIEMRIFTTTLAVHRQAGGNLGQTLERMAAVIRDRMAYRRQLKAATGAGRFSTLLITSVGPFLFAYMFFFQPEYVKPLLSETLGQSLLITAVVLETLGLFWVARLLKSEF